MCVQNMRRKMVNSNMLVWLLSTTLISFVSSQQAIDPPVAGQQPGNTAKLYLVGNTNCAEDIEKYCASIKGPQLTDLALLECLQNAGMSESTTLTGTCESAVWEFKLDVTSDERFRASLQSYCSVELAANAELGKCNNLRDHGEGLSCMMEHARELDQKSRCYQFMYRIEKIVFSDFRLVGSFATKCRESIKNLNCGSLTPPDKANKYRFPHSQGAVVECLIDKMVKQPKEHEHHLKEIDEGCRMEIMRIAELQSEDFHLDRPLFFACRQDREVFCRDVQSGQGKIFECLVQHKDDARMNAECSKILTERAQLMGQDYRLAHPLLKGCDNELKAYNCVPNPQGLAMSKNFHLTQVLLCLENGYHQSKLDENNKDPKKQMQPFRIECQHEMLTFRSILTQEFHMSPEIILHCGQEISQFCSATGDIEKEGKTLHCLMKKAEEREEGKKISQQCLNAITTLVKVADIGNSYKVDKILMASCKGLIEGRCSRDAQSEAATLNCLMQHIDTEFMVPECEDRLIEVQYFMARDWTLEPQLYDACHSEAVKRCSALDNWHMGTNEANKVDPGPQVLACLYRAGYDEENPLSQQCAKEVRKTLRSRALRVNLLPDVEEFCRGALSEYCSSNTAPREEMMCLQTYFEDDKFRKHYPDCYTSVSKFTKMESKDTKLNRLLTRACKPVISSYCEQFANEDIDHGDVMDCLVQHKDTDEMTHKCRSYVHHFELISLRDYHFSYKFAQACQSDITSHCKTYGDDKGAVIRCLSNIAFEHRILESKLDLSKDCKKQLRVQYLQQEQVNFDDKKHMKDADPQLMTKCAVEIEKLQCMKASKFEDVVECLRRGYNELGADCRAMIFGREKIEAIDNTFDHELQKSCKIDITRYCSGENSERVLSCLSNSRIIRLLQQDCQKVVRQRLMEQTQDVRLNPSLLEHCKIEAETYCPDDFKLLNNPRYTQQQMTGIFVVCLRDKYASQKAHLSTPCKNEISNIIIESEFDIALDPQLYKACQTIINRHCSNSIIAKNGKFDTVLECLKADFYSGVISDKECAAQISRRTQESLVDINLDPILHEACSADIMRNCRDTPPGQSRIITCLLDALEVPRIQISSECRNKLMERKKLWNLAHDEYKMAVPDDWAAILDIVSNHPQRNSIATFAGIFILIILVIGCCCGRCTKRTHMELKNR
uniref:Golgi apparatus protein 1 n=1 Tax=Rhabditophanes sp. KR3021 TaxID=114890 RepID=A0AC35TWW4_9BILA